MGSGLGLWHWPAVWLVIRAIEPKVAKLAFCPEIILQIQTIKLTMLGSPNPFSHNPLIDKSNGHTDAEHNNMDEEYKEKLQSRWMYFLSTFLLQGVQVQLMLQLCHCEVFCFILRTA